MKNGNIMSGYGYTTHGSMTLHHQDGKVRDLSRMVRGLRQEQIVAIHVDARLHVTGGDRPMTIHYFTEGGLDVKSKRLVFVPLKPGWATIYGFHEIEGIACLTGNRAIKQMREDPTAIGQLVDGIKQVHDHTGLSTRRLQLSGKQDITLLQKDGRWHDLSAKIGRPGMIVIDTDATRSTIYAFRTVDLENRRNAVISIDAQ